MIALRQEKDMSSLSGETSRPFLAFVNDEATADIVRKVAEQRDFPADNVIAGDLDDAINNLAAISTPPLLVIDLGKAPDVMIEAERLAHVCDPEARVILLGEVNDLHVYREVIAAGVADYLIKPFTENDLLESFERARPQEKKQTAKAELPDTIEKAVVAAVIGVRGGVGASTIAANAAWHAANTLGNQITLIDMDLTFGTQALILDVDPGSGLSDAMREPGRMDELFVKRASVGVGDTLRVMASETDLSKGDIASALAFNGLLDFIREETTLVVVDLPRALAVNQPEILDVLDRIVLVAEPSLAAMRDTARLMGHIKARNPAAKVSVVMNRQGIAAKEELARKTFEDGAGLHISNVLPFDPKAAISAEASGACVLSIAAKSKLGRALVDVSALIAGVEEAGKKKGLFSGLFKGSSKKKEAEDT